MPKGSPRIPARQELKYFGENSILPALDASKVPKKPKKKVALAPVRIVAEPVAPVQTLLVVRKPFAGQTRQAIDAINRANTERNGWQGKILATTTSLGPKKIGACGTVF